jgi:hypothetical protein
LNLALNLDFGLFNQCYIKPTKGPNNTTLHNMETTVRSGLTILPTYPNKKESGENHDFGVNGHFVQALREAMTFIIALV